MWICLCWPTWLVTEYNTEENILLVLTIFGEEVDDCVGLTVAVEVSQLRTAVNRHVVDAEAPFAAAAGVQHRTLQENKWQIFIVYKWT